MTYSEKLKDPRWQKKRLKILERDNFTCKNCKSTKMPLNVHHNYYSVGKSIWDYPDDAFTTLCEDCHKKEHNLKNSLISEIKNALQTLRVEELRQISYLVCNTKRDNNITNPLKIAESLLIADNDITQIIWILYDEIQHRHFGVTPSNYKLITVEE